MSDETWRMLILFGYLAVVSVAGFIAAAIAGRHCRHEPSRDDERRGPHLWMTTTSEPSPPVSGAREKEDG